MATCKEKTLNIILSFLPVANITLFVLSSNFIIISLNPAVEWSNYEDDFGWGMQARYFHTIWTYLDRGVIEGVVQGVPKYSPVLMDIPKTDWKNPIRNQLYRSAGIIGGATFLVILSSIIHGVTKQKLFVVICNILGSGLGIAADYFNMCITKKYRESLYLDVSKNGKHLYNAKCNTMSLGYHLVIYGSILALVASGLLLFNMMLYVPYSEGKWIWNKSVEVLPDRDVKILMQKAPIATAFTERPKSDEMTVHDLDTK